MRWISIDIVPLLHYGIVSLLVITPSCIESYPVEPRDFDRAMVVEGYFTDEAKAHKVKLSYTREVGDLNNKPLENAEVWVEGSDGSRIVFSEIRPGYYETDSSVFGRSGISYQLRIKLPSGSQYTSSPQRLLDSPPIDSIYHKYKELIVVPEQPVYPGIQFFVSTHDPFDQAKHYRYEWEETYEIRPPFPSIYEFFDDPDTVYLRREQIHICYTTEYSNDIILGSTSSLVNNQLTGLNIRYITNQTDHLKYAYSLLVKQYSISNSAYIFYRNLLDRNENAGSLFDVQLGALIGNIKSLTNEEEVVLGMFEVAGTSSQRTFLKFENLDSRFPSPEDKFPCALGQIDTVIEKGPPPPYGISDSLAYYVKTRGYEVVEALYCDSTRLIDESCPFYMRALVAPKYCADCRFRGTTQKPKFWIY
ncbi:MAG: DUF4249 domain-containing protein [Cyclobacteriaceae bacterium]